MLGQIVRGAVRMSAASVLGAAPGAIYAALVATVHLAVYGRWDRVPAFAVGCVMAGALLGLLVGIKWALSRQAAPGRSPPPTACRVLVPAGSSGRRRSSQALLAMPARQAGIV